MHVVGIANVAAETSLGAVDLAGAVVMSVFLRRISGVTLLERSLVKRSTTWPAPAPSFPGSREAR